jgi:superfamily II DNA helicase RecQ
MPEKKRFIDAPIGEAMPDGMSEVVSVVERVFKVQMAVWQAIVIRAMMEGRDVLVRAGTGAGKSLIYQAMAVAVKEQKDKGGIVLVVQPILALMEDQARDHIRFILTDRLSL